MFKLQQKRDVDEKEAKKGLEAVEARWRRWRRINKQKKQTVGALKILQLQASPALNFLWPFFTILWTF